MQMLAKHAPYKHVLDVGCHTGDFTRALAPMCDRITGIDLIADAIENARSNHEFSNIDYHCSDIESWHAAAGTYDLIVAADVLYYFLYAAQDQHPDKGWKVLRETLEKFRSWLAPGGLVFFSAVIQSVCDRYGKIGAEPIMDVFAESFDEVERESLMLPDLKQKMVLYRRRP